MELRKREAIPAASCILEFQIPVLEKDQQFGVIEGAMDGRNMFIWIVLVLILFVILGTLEGILLPEGEF